MDKNYNFIDESGNAEFFGKGGKQLWLEEGWHPLLIMGLAQTEDRKLLRKEIMEIHEEIVNDPLYKGIYSIDNKSHYFHARVDHPEIRAAFFQFLKRRTDFICYFVITYKNPDLFITNFNKSATKFYFNCVKKLLELSCFNKSKKHHFYLSQRNKTTNERFAEVIKDALVLEMSEDQLDYQAEIVKSSEYPELCVIDYVLWALQRYLLKGEKRFLNALEGKINLIQVCDGKDDKINIYSLSDFLSLRG